MTGSRAAFVDIDSNITGTVRFGNGTIIHIEGRDTVLFALKSGEHCALDNVYYIPRLTAHIISVGQLDERGYKVQIEHGVMWIQDECRHLLAKIHQRPNRLYVLNANLARPVCLAARTREDAWRWHARFGHAGFTALRRMAKEQLVRGLPPLEQVEQLCDACLEGKQRRAPFPKEALHRASKQLKRVHGDLCGPMTPTTPSGNAYFLLLVDDYNRFMWAALLPTKDCIANMAPFAICSSCFW
jgi:hypothetical protein